MSPPKFLRAFLAGNVPMDSAPKEAPKWSAETSQQAVKNAHAAWAQYVASETRKVD
jgi:hypothetical protein